MSSPRTIAHPSASLRAPGCEVYSPLAMLANTASHTPSPSGEASALASHDGSSPSSDAGSYLAGIKNSETHNNLHAKINVGGRENEITAPSVSTGSIIGSTDDAAMIEGEGFRFSPQTSWHSRVWRRSTLDSPRSSRTPPSARPLHSPRSLGSFPSDLSLLAQQHLSPDTPTTRRHTHSDALDTHTPTTQHLLTGLLDLNTTTPPPFKSLPSSPRLLADDRAERETGKPLTLNVSEVETFLVPLDLTPYYTRMPSQEEVRSHLMEVEAHTPTTDELPRPPRWLASPQNGLRGSRKSFGCLTDEKEGAVIEQRQDRSASADNLGKMIDRSEVSERVTSSPVSESGRGGVRPK
eukprot:GHVN01085895.1.p1 GENE.GHVN01085895.1~~GHVN01085895.1.p1  ORF type:complete len:365 (-),score=104.25 GHVN01085895.1:1287-2339(-)